jgi:hypothetical protein
MTDRRRQIICTRDAVVPRADDDRAMANGWRCIPVAPTDAAWVIVDSTHDRKTGWLRVHHRGRA